MTRRRSRGCLSSCFSTPIRRRRRRSPWTSTPPTTRCTGIRKSVSSTAITTTTVICRSMCSAAGIYWPPNCARPTSTPAPAASKRWRGSAPASASAGRRACPRESGVRILLRADSGFAREALMAWCENCGVDFLFGLSNLPSQGEGGKVWNRRICAVQPFPDRNGNSEARITEAGLRVLWNPVLGRGAEGSAASRPERRSRGAAPPAIAGGGACLIQPRQRRHDGLGLLDDDHVPGGGNRDELGAGDSAARVKAPTL